MSKLLENILEVRVKDEVFGFDADLVEQILVVPPITKVPLSGDEVLGVAVLGGKVVNVIDIGVVVSDRTVDITNEKSRLLTFSNSTESIVVDEVLNMIDVDMNNFDDNSDDETSFIAGFYKGDKTVIQVLNFEKLLESISMGKFIPKVVNSLEDDKEAVVNRNNYEEITHRGLFFKAGDENFIIDIEILRELIFVPDEIIPIAGSDALGMITLRNRVISLLDMNKLLGFESKEASEKSRIVIAIHQHKVVGFLLDEVEEVKTLKSENFEKIDSEMISSLYKDEDTIFSMLSNDFIRDLIRNYYIEEEEEFEELDKQEEGILSEIAVFKIADEEYAFDIEEVQEIIRYENITPVPEAPQFVEGILNLRGAVISVVSLPKRLGFDTKIDDKTKIIVCLIEGEKIGFIVDDVNEILFVEDKYISKSASSDALFDEVINLDDGERVILKIKVSNLLDESTLENIRQMEN